MATIVSFLGSVPAYYDQYLGPFLFEPYAIDLVKRIDNNIENAILELACGTGRVTFHLSKLTAEKASLIATDLNQDMLTLAKQKVPNKNVQWHVVDAQDLPFKEESFTVVVCQFGVMFFPDKLKAFKEAYRVLKREGTFLFNTWDSFKTNPANEIIQNVLQEILKEEAPDFLLKGPFSFYDEGEINQLLQQAGFNTISIEKVPKTGITESVEHVINGFTKGTPLAVYLNEKDSNRQQEIIERLRTAISAEYGEKDLHIPIQALVCKAVK